MRAEAWEYVLGAIFLLICLFIGIGWSSQIETEPVLGVLRFDGVIDFDTANHLITVMDEARRDESVAGVVVELLSPGGFATSSESIFYSMLQLRETKPLVVYIDSLAVSGGYYMAVASNRIYIPPSARVGNVGARTLEPSDPTIIPEELSTGPYKFNGGSRFDQVRQLELVARAFAGSVVQQRANAADNPLQIGLEEVSQARIYLGSEAVALGLADYEGGRSDAIAGAAELAGLPAYRVVDLEEYLGIEPLETTIPNLETAAQSLIEQALPDTIFLLDSRISLMPGVEQSALNEHLLSLRARDINPSPGGPAPEATPDFLRDVLPTGARTR
jgi:protease-4